MPDQGFDELVLLYKKVDELLERFKNLKAENQVLRSENETLKLRIQAGNEKYKDLETKYERIKLSGALLGEGGNSTEAKRKITELVREIDRCVALLNR